MLARELERAVRRKADQESARLAEVPATRLLYADVSAVTEGAASDGNGLVTVSWRGGEYTVAGYPDSYTPAVGHRVLCALVEAQLVILHHSIGGP
jgi:hypothetical protein